MVVKNLKRRYLAITLACLGGITALAALNLKRPSGPTEVKILHSANPLLDLEPCRCDYRSVGGLERAWAFLQRYRQTRAIPYFISGTAFVPNAGSFSMDSLGRYRTESLALAKVFRQFNVTALAPSLEDLALGRDFLKELESTAGVPFISTNLFSAAEGSPLFKRYLEIPQAGASLLVVGLSSSRHLGYPENPAVVVRNPAAALRELLASLPPKPRLIVVLSSLWDSERKTLAAEFPEIAVILGGASSQATEDVQTPSPLQLWANPEGSTRAMTWLELSVAPALSPSSAPRFTTRKAEVVPLDNSFQVEAKEITALLAPVRRAPQPAHPSESTRQ